MDCATCEDKIYEYLYDILEASDRQELQAHLEQCNDCRRLLKQNQEAVTMLDNWQMGDCPDLVAKTMERIPTNVVRPDWLVLKWASVAAAILVCFALTMPYILPYPRGNKTTVAKEMPRTTTIKTATKAETERKEQEQKEDNKGKSYLHRIHKFLSPKKEHEGDMAKKDSVKETKKQNKERAENDDLEEEFADETETESEEKGIAETAGMDAQEMAVEDAGELMPGMMVRRMRKDRQAIKAPSVMDKVKLEVATESIKAEWTKAKKTIATKAPVKIPFVLTSQKPHSRFAVDIDNASYNYCRKTITVGKLPAKELVRVEEFINYFRYDYRQPDSNQVFSLNVELAACPWNTENYLLHIGVKTRENQTKPPRNLVFILDLSESMTWPNKLPLVKNSLKFLTEKLNSRDRITLMTYAGKIDMPLASVPGDQKQKIIAALDKLKAHGIVHGELPIPYAFEKAQQDFIVGGVNRVILIGDGHFKASIGQFEKIRHIIQQKQEQGITLSVFGFGMGGYKDPMMEKLAAKGSYHYIDNSKQARKLVIQNIAGEKNIAEAVEAGIKFEPKYVTAYRLLEYQNTEEQQQIEQENLGPEHMVTVIYELQPSKFFKKETLLAHLQIKYDQPVSGKKQIIAMPVLAKEVWRKRPSPDFDWASAAAGFALLLSDASHRGNLNYDMVIELAQGAKGQDSLGQRQEFIELAQKTRKLDSK